MGRPILRAVGEMNPCRMEDTIVVAGSPRSGTTWMLELLHALPEYKALNEPLKRSQAFEKYGFEWRTYLDPESPGNQYEEYFEKILTGRIGVSGWHFEAKTRIAQLFEYVERNHLIVKFCRLNRMLHWFASRYSVRGPVFVVRHPCAVVASMMNHGSWSEQEHLNTLGATRCEQALHGGSLPESLRDPFEPILERISTRAEVLATMWCLDHYVPLLHQADRGYPWIMAPYERLVVKGREELQRIAEGIGVDMTREMVDRLDEPSSSVKDRLHRDARQQLSKWHRRLDPRQIDDVLQIVDQVGLSKYYTDQTEPDYDALRSCQHLTYAW